MHKETKLPVQRLFYAFLIILVILAADQWIKVYIKTSFSPNEIRPLIGEWFVLQYIENQGMAFGATFSSSQWGKLSLSIFRIVAICGIAYYLFSQIKRGARNEFVFALSLILAGATGNLIDSMFYDFLFPYDPCSIFNDSPGSGVKQMCPPFGEIEVKHRGFLFGNVVDMFRFQANWPQWIPWLGGKDVFPAIWNLADGSITVGVFMVLFRQRKYFPKQSEPVVSAPEQDAFLSDLEDGVGSESK